MTGTNKTLGCFMALVLALIWPMIAAAHPGHGRDGGSFSLFHYLTEPLHLAVAAVLLGAVVVMVFRLSAKNGRARRIKRK